ncbi:MAG: hypothetical protein NVSMB38_13230 [Ktedonobacteraceae bacterium]
MNKPMSLTRPESDSLAPQADGLLRTSSVVNAFALVIIGVVMMVMGFLTPIGVVLQAVEIALGLGVVLSGVLLWKAVTNKKQASINISILPGELALAVGIVYLGVAMPTFHVHGSSVSYLESLIQFITVLAGLVFGATALTVSGASKIVRPSGKFSPTAVIRDGVILIAGTILLAIALGQLAGGALKPPLWNWISFGGITIPGMLLLIAREGVKEGTENWSHGSLLRGVFSLLATESLLIIGLAIMLAGSYYNLTLGANGFTVGFKGNAAGLTLFVVAILFFLLVRGFFKLTFLSRTQLTSFRIVNKLLFVVAVIAFIYGERSVLSGKPPMFAVGGAAPEVTLILLGAFFVLIVGRVFAQKFSTASIQQ